MKPSINDKIKESETNNHYIRTVRIDDLRKVCPHMHK